MQRVFGALLASYVIVIGATMAVGFWVHDPRSFAVHFAMGLVATILTCLIYCVLLTYFVITGKLIKQAVQSAGLEKDLIQQSQKPKARIVLLTALAVGVTLVAALLGAWANVSVDQQSARPFMHMCAEFLALCVNLAAFSVCYQEVRRNSRLFERVFAQVNGDAGSSIETAKSRSPHNHDSHHRSEAPESSVIGYTDCSR